MNQQYRTESDNVPSPSEYNTLGHRLAQIHSKPLLASVHFSFTMHICAAQ